MSRAFLLSGRSSSSSRNRTSRSGRAWVFGSSLEHSVLGYGWRCVVDFDCSCALTCQWCIAFVSLSPPGCLMHFFTLCFSRWFLIVTCARTHVLANDRLIRKNLMFGKVLESAHGFFYLSAAAGSPTLLTSPKRQAMSWLRGCVGHCGRNTHQFQLVPRRNRSNFTGNKFLCFDW